MFLNVFEVMNKTVFWIDNRKNVSTEVLVLVKKKNVSIIRYIHYYENLNKLYQKVSFPSEWFTDNSSFIFIFLISIYCLAYRLFSFYTTSFLPTTTIRVPAQEVLTTVISFCFMNANSGREIQGPPLISEWDILYDPSSEQVHSPLSGLYENNQ